MTRMSIVKKSTNILLLKILFILPLSISYFIHIYFIHKMQFHFSLYFQVTFWNLSLQWTAKPEGPSQKCYHRKEKRKHNDLKR